MGCKVKNNLVKPRFQASVTDNTLEILVYEEIGENWWSGGGVTAKTVTDSIKAAGGFDRIAVRINSPGGDCFEGVAIYNLLRSQNKPVDVYVDGIAASAASVIAMAGDTISVGVGAMLMIHNAACMAFGEAAALRKMADTLENISVTVGGIYVLRTGQDAAAVKELMDAETWMSADEAIAKGFATAVMNQPKDDQAQARALAAKFSLRGFKHVPEKLSGKGVRNESVDPQCTCPCGPCTTSGCAGCENDPCTFEGCACPNNDTEEMSSGFFPSLDLLQRRAALRERMTQ